MTYYRELDVLQEPTDVGLDAAGRARVAFNVYAIKEASATFAEELAARLVSQGVVASGQVYIGTAAEPVPPCVSIILTGGRAPERLQDQISPPAYQQPTAQIVARAATYAEAHALARAAYNVLVGVRNVDLVA
jgi:hypothetical protein